MTKTLKAGFPHPCPLGLIFSQPLRRGQLGHALGGPDEPVPVVQHVVGRAAFGGDGLCDLDRGDHFDRIPGTDRQLVRIALLCRHVHAHLATDAALDIDFAP